MKIDKEYIFKEIDISLRSFKLINSKNGTVSYDLQMIEPELIFLTNYDKVINFVEQSKDKEVHAKWEILDRVSKKLMLHDKTYSTLHKALAAELGKVDENRKVKENFELRGFDWKGLPVIQKLIKEQEDRIKELEGIIKNG